MRLVQFSLERFRSFTDKSTVNFSNNNVIIGPNNEGKTNILKALAISWDFLMDFAKNKLPCYLSEKELLFAAMDSNLNDYYTKQTREQPQPFTMYVWGLDYPVVLRDNKDDNQNKNSTFILCFELTDEEKKKLESQINISINSIVSIRIDMGQECTKLSVLHLEPVSEQIIKDIVRCIVQKLSFFYIEAVRTAKSASKMIDDLLNMELGNVYRSKEYLTVENQLFNFLDPSIRKLFNLVNNNLKLFIPSTHDNSFTFYHSNRPLQDLQVLIDDGNITPITQKGAGVQSLVAISLAQLISLSQVHDDNLLLAIEEPEAHLHPKAIHEIKKVLSDIAKHNQLIITTHSPVLANTSNVESNIIVTNNNAHQALSLKEVRETLGVLASDNLLFADNTILVEGLSDQLILENILPSLSVRIALALREGTLIIFNCQGASKISAFASIVKRFICRYYIVLDNDKAGQNERNNLVNNNPDLSKIITSFATTDMNESEIEDFIIPEIYVDELIKLFGFGNRNSWLSILNGSYKSWSDRLNEFAKRNGHPISDTEMIQAKTTVAKAVVDNGISAIIPSRKCVFDTLAQNIEKMLDE